MSKDSNLIGLPWAIRPETLAEIQTLQLARVQTSALPQPRLSCRADSGSFQVINGVAVLHVSGILAKRNTPLMDAFGGTSTELLARQFSVAQAEPSVKTIALVIDSPGGTVDGTQALADQIYASRGKKSVIAIADGCMCSAAYWIGASADTIYASSGVAQIGSIGVAASHLDISGHQAQRGIKTTEVTAGKYKRIASNYAPLSTEGKASIQSTVDYLYSIFVGHIARARGVSEVTVLDRMADGRVFIGQQAVDAGLIDGILTLDNLIKGGKPMPTKLTSSTACAGDSRDRDGLHERAKAYQANHPGTDYLAAIKAVTKEPLFLGGEAAMQDSNRADLHARAKDYQSNHPGTDYLAALQVVSKTTVG